MLLQRFLKKCVFDNYDDYKENAVPVVPDNFNFAYDVVDQIAKEQPLAISRQNRYNKKKT